MVSHNPVQLSLVSKLEEENIPVPPFESKTNDSITDIVVTASEIVDFIRILDLKKASGPDKISRTTSNYQ
jgi:hypothetical protein